MSRLKQIGVKYGDIQDYLKRQGLKKTDLGWVSSERLKEMVSNGYVSEYNGRVVYTPSGINYGTDKIYKYITNSSSLLKTTTEAVGEGNQKVDPESAGKDFVKDQFGGDWEPLTVTR